MTSRFAAIWLVKTKEAPLGAASL